MDIQIKDLLIEFFKQKESNIAEKYLNVKEKVNE